MRFRLIGLLGLALIGVSPASYAVPCCVLDMEPDLVVENAYVGALVSGVQVKNTLNVVFPENVGTPLIDSSLSFSESLFTGGLALGYEANTCHYLFAVEVNSQPVPIKTSQEWSPSGFPLRSEINIFNFVNFDGLFGYRLSRCVTAYLRGGVAVATVNLKQDQYFNRDLNFNNTAYGPHVGIGLDWRFSEHWSTGIDYIYTQFLQSKFKTIDPVTKLQTAFNLKSEMNQVGLHLYYHFG